MNGFESILFKKTPHSLEKEALPFFSDLNLDDFIHTITNINKNEKLEWYYYTLLHDTESIIYRQQIFRDLDNSELCGLLSNFCENIHQIRSELKRIQQSDYKYQKARLFVELVKQYCYFILQLEKSLTEINIESEGLNGFYKHIKQYICSDYFNYLQKEADEISRELSKIHINISIKGLQVRVSPVFSKNDLNDEIQTLFERFQTKEFTNYQTRSIHPYEISHVENNIIEAVANIYPKEFEHLLNFYTNNQNFIDEGVQTFVNEMPFYFSYLEYIKPIKKKGLPFCYPTINNSDKNIYCNSTYNLVLAHKNVKQSHEVVLNDFYLKRPEHVIVITGPNQSGKTTFARTIGQLHYLMSIGCPIPGTDAKLFLFDQMYTHFEKKESLQDIKSKLEKDLSQLNTILKNSTDKSIIILNEIFISSTFHDARLLSRKIMKKIIDLNSFCVWVTFIDDLSSYDEHIVSMCGDVDPQDPDIRTFKFVRKAANGIAYALSIAKKYHLTYEAILNQFKS